MANQGNTPGSSWNSLFGNVGGQGNQFDGPISPSNTYLGFLSKADLDDVANVYDVLFELVPIEWAVNVLVVSSSDAEYPAPPSPATLYHMTNVDPTALLDMLGLKSADDLAEGSWYFLQLEQGSTGKLTGDLYDPDIDMQGIPS
jgi:hypothetical protein